MGREVALRAEVGGSRADAMLIRGEKRTMARAEPREGDACDAGKSNFLRTDIGDGIAEDAIWRIAGLSVVNNFRVDFAKDAPIVHGGDRPRSADELLDVRETL